MFVWSKMSTHFCVEPVILLVANFSLRDFLGHWNCQSAFVFFSHAMLYYVSCVTEL